MTRSVGSTPSAVWPLMKRLRGCLSYKTVRTVLYDIKKELRRRALCRELQQVGRDTLRTIASKDWFRKIAEQEFTAHKIPIKDRGIDYHHLSLAQVRWLLEWVVEFQREDVQALYALKGL